MIETKINGLFRLEPTMFFHDERGSITELFDNQKITTVKHTVSLPNTLRGVHVQNQDKIVYPASGKVFSVYVDVRDYSATYGVTQAVLDDDDSRSAYFIPKGVGISYCVIGDKPSDYFYFAFDKFDPEGVDNLTSSDFSYPLTKPAVMSEKDRDATMHYYDFRWSE